MHSIQRAITRAHACSRGVSCRPNSVAFLRLRGHSVIRTPRLRIYSVAQFEGREELAARHRDSALGVEEDVFEKKGYWRPLLGFWS
jgi:hypothetical protein